MFKIYKRKIRKIYKKKLKKIKQRFNSLLQNEKNKFIRILRHDIKTPLLAQIQTLKLLDEGKFGELTKIQQDIIDEILNSNNILYDIISNTIFLSDYENKKPKLKLEDIYIKDEIKEICDSLKNHAYNNKNK